MDQIIWNFSIYVPVKHFIAYYGHYAWKIKIVSTCDEKKNDEEDIKKKKQEWHQNVFMQNLHFCNIFINLSNFWKFMLMFALPWKVKYFQEINTTYPKWHGW